MKRFKKCSMFKIKISISGDKLFNSRVTFLRGITNGRLVLGALVKLSGIKISNFRIISGI